MHGGYETVSPDRLACQSAQAMNPTMFSRPERVGSFASRHGRSTLDPALETDPHVVEGEIAPLLYTRDRARGALFLQKSFTYGRRDTAPVDNFQVNDTGRAPPAPALDGSARAVDDRKSEAASDSTGVR